jgi:hypothetical protein
MSSLVCWGKLPPGRERARERREGASCARKWVMVVGVRDVREVWGTHQLRMERRRE